MKKVLYGVALTLFAGVSVGSLQSCKDDVADLRTQTSYDLTKLQSQLNGEAARLEGLINAEAAARQADIAAVNRLIAGLQTADRDLADKVDGVTSRLDNVEALLPNMEEGDRLASQAYVDGKAEALQAEIDALKQYVTEGDEALEALIRDTQEALTMALNAHAADIEEIQGTLDEIRDEIVKIENAIDSIIQLIDKQVTGILVQSAYSPAFGESALPIGVRSNILFNWYGENALNESYTFPSASKTYSANGEPGLDLTKVAPAEYFTVPEGVYGDQGADMTLGTVYTTLNPVGAQFDELVVKLETSGGTQLPWPVALTPSKHEIKFGYTRAEEEEDLANNNSFYEGSLVAPVEEAIDGEFSVAVKIEDGLKTSMKDALKNPSLTTAKGLVKSVYEQLSGKLPAYALRYDWNTPGIGLDVDPGFSVKAYSVLSQYELAVATAKPISYVFLADYTGSEKLPTFGHIQNYINKLREIGQFSFKFEPFKVDNITIDLGQITFEGVNTDLEFSLTDVTLTYEDGTKVTASTEEPIIIKGDESGMNDMLEEIKNAINSTLKSADSSVNTQLASLTSNIEKQVNDMMDKINEQVNGKINDVINSFENKLEPYFGKIDQAIDIYNKIAGKLNNFFINPNAYLQVTAFYKMGNDYGIVSGKESDPTTFEGNGQAFKLYLSSYTAELIAPACKKYVAITGAPEGVDLSAINTGDLNKVLDGNQVEIEVAKPSKAGVYEFTYQALDYSGYTSTKKFYIQVK